MRPRHVRQQIIARTAAECIVARGRACCLMIAMRHAHRELETRALRAKLVLPGRSDAEKQQWRLKEDNIERDAEVECEAAALQVRRAGDRCDRLPGGLR